MKKMQPSAYRPRKRKGTEYRTLAMPPVAMVRQNQVHVKWRMRSRQGSLVCLRATAGSSGSSCGWEGVVFFSTMLCGGGGGGGRWEAVVAVPFPPRIDDPSAESRTCSLASTSSTSSSPASPSTSSSSFSSLPLPLPLPLPLKLELLFSPPSPLPPTNPMFTTNSSNGSRSTLCGSGVSTSSWFRQRLRSAALDTVSTLSLRLLFTSRSRSERGETGW